MRIYDISLTIRPDMPIWPGDPRVVIERWISLNQGDSANVSHLELGTHAGTHVDPPAHVILGRKGVDVLDLNALVGLAYVVELDVEEGITATDLEAAGLPADATRLLCKTCNSQHWTEHPMEFVTDFVYLSPDAAQWLVDHGYRLVGVDYLSVDSFEAAGDDIPTHHILLDAEIVVVEGLNLAGIRPGRYMLVCLPLKIENGDGAPCRAILIDNYPRCHSEAVPKSLSVGRARDSFLRQAQDRLASLLRMTGEVNLD